jgi:hypothetical protein
MLVTTVNTSDTTSKIIYNVRHKITCITATCIALSIGVTACYYHWYHNCYYQCALVSLLAITNSVTIATTNAQWCHCLLLLKLLLLP